MLNWGNFQFGLDLATSVAIIGSAITFLWQLNKSRQLAAERGLEQQAIAHAASILGAASERASKKFITDIVDQESNFDRALGISNANNLEELAQRLERKPELCDMMCKSAESFRNAVGDYYDLTQRYRYTLIPVLEPLRGRRQIYRQTAQRYRSHSRRS